jgi:hypothetical protein
MGSSDKYERFLKYQADKIVRYEQALQAIANDHHELSDHKIEVQNRNYKKLARQALEEKMNYQKKLAEAPYHPGYEDAVVAEPRPVLYGIYKSKPLTNEEITGIRMQTEGDIIAFARAIEERHGIK